MWSIIPSIYLAWLGLSLTFQLLECLRKSLRVQGLTRFCLGPKTELIDGHEIRIGSQIFNDSTLPQVQRFEWFSKTDILYKIVMVNIGFYFGLISHPLSFISYTYLYNRIFSGPLRAAISVVLLPVWPVCLLLLALYHRNLAFLPMLNVEDEELESLQFFKNSLGPVAGLLYDYGQEYGNYVGNFYLLGPNVLPIQTMYWDTDITTKVFWREQLQQHGARVAADIGVWDGAVLELKCEVEQFEGLVIKVSNSCMGVGDMFLRRGRDYTTSADIEQIFQDKYPASPCILIEFITAHPALQVHSLDILTAKDPQGQVQLFDVIVWAGSSSETSHGATDCYMVDPRTGRTCSLGRWYNPNFLGTSPAGLGVFYPKVAAAVATALKTHRDLPYPWLSVVGWDCMVNEDSEMVFFEGNLASWRCPRRLFLSLRNFIYFTSYVSWVSKGL